MRHGAYHQIWDGFVSGYDCFSPAKNRGKAERTRTARERLRDFSELHGGEMPGTLSAGGRRRYEKGLRELMGNDDFHVLMVCALLSGSKVKMSVILEAKPIKQVSDKHKLDSACLTLMALHALRERIVGGGGVTVLETKTGGFRYDTEMYPQMNALNSELFNYQMTRDSPK